MECWNIDETTFSNALAIAVPSLVSPAATKLGVRPFDVADYLQNDEDIAEYLT